MKNFKKLLIWQKGFDIAVKSFLFVKLLPSEERFGLSSQITRAAVSISANIAEGSSRSSLKDFNRFLEISLGSCFELETHLLLAETLIGNDNELLMFLLKQLDEEQKMLMSFMNKIASKLS